MGTSRALHGITRVLKTFASAKGSNFRASEAIQYCKGSKSAATPSTKEHRQPLGYARAHP
eukprot:11209695-Lingulodinium_polyedra.AAC.1